MTYPIVQLRETPLPGCLEIVSRRQQDLRGDFIKVYHRETFMAHGLTADFPEVYYTHSCRDVIRGLHFQLPPADHAKIVFCVQGRVRDAVVDLRAGSPTYHRHTLLELSAESANALYIPAGMAHGFCVLSDWATLIYMVSSQYAPEHDTGILWNSAGIDWGIDAPLLSDRDRTLLPLTKFRTPFRFAGGEMHT